MTLPRIPPEEVAGRFLPAGVSYDEAMAVPQNAWGYIAGTVEMTDRDFEEVTESTSCRLSSGCTRRGWPRRPLPPSSTWTWRTSTARSPLRHLVGVVVVVRERAVDVRHVQVELGGDSLGGHPLLVYPLDNLQDADPAIFDPRLAAHHALLRDNPVHTSLSHVGVINGHCR